MIFESPIEITKREIKQLWNKKLFKPENLFPFMANEYIISLNEDSLKTDLTGNSLADVLSKHGFDPTKFTLLAFPTPDGTYLVRADEKDFRQVYETWKDQGIKEIRGLGPNRTISCA